MTDGVNVATVPPADLHAAYSNGLYANTHLMLAKFPTSKIVTIDVNGSDPTADILDVERYDATPTQVPGWIARGGKGVYCSVGAWTEIIADLNGVTPPAGYWIASPGATGISPEWERLGCYAVQNVFAGGYDQSVVLDYWPGIDPPEMEDVVIWGSDLSTTNQRIVDGRMVHIREWWHEYKNAEPTVQQQQDAYQVWAQKGGDLTLAGIIDGTIS